MSASPTVAIVMPVLNEISMMPSLLRYLNSIDADEVIVVDGGSKDGSLEALQSEGISVVSSVSGRAKQMNMGARVVVSDYIVFLHADTKLPQNYRSELRDLWGRFDVRFDSDLQAMKVVSWFMNQRSRLTSIATGDQAIFVQREMFNSVGGFKQMAIMEDVELSHRLRKLARPHTSNFKVTTSARRWEQDGILKTIFLMWRLRLAFTLGARSSVLKQDYRDVR